MNPLDLAAFPNLFKFHRGTGELRVDPEVCANAPSFMPNHCGSTEALVENTIRVLNLNCDRLCQDRLRVSRQLERNLNQLLRQKTPKDQAESTLARRYFQRRWTRFFTVIRACLGPAAETHLQTIGYQG